MAARLNPLRVTHPFQIGTRGIAPMATGIAGGSGAASPAAVMGRFGPGGTMGGRGYGGGYPYGGGGGYGMAQPMRINAKPTMAATADDVIRQQGGLSPSYGPTGINSTYGPQSVGALDRLQDSKFIAENQNNPQRADDLEKAQQAESMGFKPVAQGITDNVNAANILGKTGQQATAPQWTPPPVPSGTTVTPDAAYAPGSAPSSLMAPFQATANDRGGNATTKGKPNVATVAEKEPEYDFKASGQVQRFDHPSLLVNPEPGVIVPNHDLQKFLQKFKHPSHDTATVALPNNVTHDPAFASGGMLGGGMAMPSTPAPSIPGALPTGPGGNSFTVMAHAAPTVRIATPGQPGTVGGPAYDRGGVIGGDQELQSFLKARAFDEGGDTTEQARQNAVNQTWTTAKSGLKDKILKTVPHDVALRYLNDIRTNPGNPLVLHSSVNNLLGSGDAGMGDASSVYGLPPGTNMEGLLQALAQDPSTYGSTSLKPSAPISPNFPDDIDNYDNLTPSVAPTPTPVVGNPTAPPAPVTATPSPVIRPPASVYQPTPPALQQFMGRRSLHSWETPGNTLADRYAAGKAAVAERAQELTDQAQADKQPANALVDRFADTGPIVGLTTPYGIARLASANERDNPQMNLGLLTNNQSMAMDEALQRASNAGYSDARLAEPGYLGTKGANIPGQTVAPVGPQPTAPAFDRGGELGKFLAKRKAKK